MILPFYIVDLPASTDKENKIARKVHSVLDEFFTNGNMKVNKNIKLNWVLFTSFFFLRMLYLI